MCFFFKVLYAYLIILVIIIIKPAFAYLDPNFLTIIFQTFVAFIAGIFVTATIWKNKIVEFLNKIFKKKNKKEM